MKLPLLVVAVTLLSASGAAAHLWADRQPLPWPAMTTSTAACNRRLRSTVMVRLSLISDAVSLTPERYDLSRNRWIFPVWVFGKASRNFTERGYL